MFPMTALMLQYTSITTYNRAASVLFIITTTLVLVWAAKTFSKRGGQGFWSQLNGVLKIFSGGVVSSWFAALFYVAKLLKAVNSDHEVIHGIDRGSFHKPTYTIPPRPLSLGIAFDPAVHIARYTKPKVHTMESIGLGTLGISPVAVSEPFEMFTKDAVMHMRDEVLSDEVWENCSYSSNRAPCQIRGMAPKYVSYPQLQPRKF